MNIDIPFSPPASELANQVNHDWFEEMYTGTLFHGTGRFHKGFDDYDKSKPNGKIEDIFDCIARNGLQPQADHVARLLFETDKTISLTRERIYARYYAQLFGSDHSGESTLQYQFGEADAWRGYYFGVTAKATKSRRNAHYLPRFIKNLCTRFTWEELKHVQDVEFHRSRWLMNRAAVTGNYPVILGINRCNVPLLTMPYGLGFFEDRTAQPIGADKIKLVEVPIIYVVETRTILRRLSLEHVTVIPMELAEVHSFRRGVSVCCAY